MRSRVLLLSKLAGLVLAASALAETTLAEPLDLKRVVELALERNPSLQAQVEQRQEVAGNVKEVAADAWPQIDLVTAWSRARNPAFLTSPDFEDIVELFPGFEPGEQELWDLGLELTQTLYSGGKVRAAIDLAELVVDITEARISSAELDTALEATEAYYRLLQAQGALQTVEIQQQARQRSLEVVEVRHELGEATQLELLRAHAALRSVAPEVARIRGQVDVEKGQLRVALGLAPGSDIEVEIEPDDLPEPPSFETLWELAREQRPELEDLRLQGDTLDRREVVTAADGGPQLELKGKYGRQSRLIDDLSDDLFDNWSVSLQMSWSLFDGGRRKGELAQLESQRRQLDWQVRELENEIARQIEAALIEYRTARERLLAAEVSAEASAEASRVALESYREGLALQADLLDAQEQEIQAEFVRVDAEFEAWIMTARLLRAIGRLPTESWEISG